MRRVIALLALAVLTAGCGDDSQSKPTAVTGSVELDRPASGAPDAGTRAGHGNDVAVATTEGPSIEIRGTVRPAESEVVVTDPSGSTAPAHGRVDAGGRFVVELDALREGLNRLLLEGRREGLAPWRVDLRITRRSTTASGSGAAARDGPAALFAATPSRARVRVPARDRTPPLALIRLKPAGGAPATIHVSPVRSPRAPPVHLRRPSFVATALIRDTDGGIGRIRVSVEYATRCPKRREHFVYFPPSQIVRVRIAPGVEAATQRTRTARVRLPRRCHAAGKLFAEATNASGLESFSDPIWFEYR